MDPALDDDEVVRDLLRRHVVRDAEVGHEAVAVVEVTLVDVAHVGRAIDRHRAGHQVMPALAEVVKTLVLARLDGNDHVDVGLTPWLVGERRKRGRERRDEDEAAHVMTLRRRRTSLKRVR